MDRVPYRRVSPPRHGPTHERDDYSHSENDGHISHGETLIMQCIICGIIMVFVLIASLVDIAPAITLRNGISQVLTGAETLDELITDVRRIGSDLLGWDIADDATAPNEFYSPSEYFPDEPPATNIESTVFPIMDHEYENETPAADEQASNPTVPEPLVTPGLWD